jgi:hypothetical protein
MDPMIKKLVDIKDRFYTQSWKTDLIFDRLSSELFIDSNISIALARGAATSSTREIDPQVPQSWEFRGFSQNGEDGIIDYLSRRLIRKNGYFIEFGTADGIENNSTWLALARRCQGIMVEGDPELARQCLSLMNRRNVAVNVLNEYIDLGNINKILDLAIYKDPDLFSLDIDSVDYYIAEACLKYGLRPKIVVAEYNSAFGPDVAATIPYKTPFDRKTSHTSQVYYGASVRALRNLFEGVGYAFVGVETNGVNAFFIDPEAFPEGFAQSLKPVEFRDNAADRNTSNAPVTSPDGRVVQPLITWKEQHALIKDLDIIYV